MSFFGLHGIRLTLETHLGLRPPRNPSRSGLVGSFREEPGLTTGNAGKASEKPPLQDCTMSELQSRCQSLCSGTAMSRAWLS